jgi:hypothetical protein
MRAKKPSQRKEIKTTALRLISGSDDEDFTTILVTQVDTCLWVEHSDSEQRVRQFNAAITAMKGMKPGDELEGMLSAQLIAIHNATMECCRRAMLGNQTFEGRRENLNQANKLSRTYAALTEALDRHRGKGQQRITVEHVNVHAGGQAIVGAVTPSDGSGRRSEEQTRATREITNEPGIPMRSPDPQWETVPIAAGARKTPV